MKITKKIKLLDFKLSKSIWSSLFWVYKSRFYGNGMDFLEHKEYQFWDSIKFIDWKASAKSEKIYRKVFEETRDLKVLFLLDLNESMFFELKERTKIDVLQEVFYALAFSAYKNNDSLWAYLFWDFKSKHITYKKNIWNIFEVIEFIEKLQTSRKLKEKSSFLNLNFFKNQLNKNTKTWLTDILEELKKLKIRDNLIFILSDNLDIKENTKKLKNLSFENEIIFINIFDYFENNLDKIWTNIVFENKGDFLDISLENEEKIKKYISLRAKKQQDFDNIMKKNNIKNIKLDTKIDVFKEMLKKL